MAPHGLLKVHGSKIVDAHDHPVRLRGFCLGGWLNMENFIAGYPGTESGFRAAMTEILGQEKARFFFERFVEHFVTRDDIRFLSSIGANVVRLPLNYRHLESDLLPFSYIEDGFRPIDRLIAWCREFHVYVVLDLHAAQGWQNPDWHCDNPLGYSFLWGEEQFQARAIALWKHIADRYKEEDIIAGYDLLNEPVARNMNSLNAFYTRLCRAIRAVDSRHILFIEGNNFSTDFEGLDAPWEGNIAYSSHHYYPPSMAEGVYPGEFDGKFYDRGALHWQYRRCTEHIRRYGVPNLVGEFGANLSSKVLLAYRIRYLRDLIDIFEQDQSHWALWTYKDIGVMGMVVVHPESEWMERTARMRGSIQRLGGYIWERKAQEVDAILERLIELTEREASIPIDTNALRMDLRRTVRGGILPVYLLRSFAEAFRGMSEHKIDQMIRSFRWDACYQRESLVTVLREFMTRSP